MKKIVGLVVVITALVLGSYYGTGLITETTLKKDFDIINQSNGLFVNIDKYDRGWFVSKAALSWRLHLPERVVKDNEGHSTVIAAKDFQLQMPLTIYHGPIIFADSSVKFGLGYAQTNLLLPQAYNEQFSNLFTAASVKPTLDLSIFVNYVAKSRVHIDLPNFKLIAKEGNTQFEWLGMKSDISASANLDKIDGNITVDGLTFAKDKTSAVLGNVTSDYELHKTTSGLYLGDADLSVPSFAVNESDKKIFEVQNVEIKSSSDISDGLFSSTFSTSLEKLFARDKSYGPGKLKMSIKNLDAEVLARLNAQANSLQQGTDAQRQQSFLSMLPELPKLFSKGAAFEVSEMSFVVPEGTIEGDFFVSLPKGDMGNPFQLIQKVQGKGKVKIPSSILKEVMQESAKQKLLKQANTASTPTDSTQVASTASEQAAQPQPQPSVTPAASTEPAAASTSTSAPTAQDSPSLPATTTVSDIDQQAGKDADQQLTELVQNGLLTTQGSDYVVELNLADGQLSVNGKPFNPDMLKF